MARRTHDHPWHGPSLRMHLTLIASGALFVALVAGAFALTTVLSRTRIDALETVVRDRVVTVAALAEDDRLPNALPVAEPGEIVQLLDADGAVLATSPNASRTLPVVPLDALPTGGGPGGISVGSTDASAYDDEALVAAAPATYSGAPVTVVATVPLAEVQSVLDALRLALDRGRPAAHARARGRGLADPRTRAAPGRGAAPGCRPGRADRRPGIAPRAEA